MAVTQGEGSAAAVTRRNLIADIALSAGLAAFVAVGTHFAAHGQHAYRPVDAATVRVAYAERDLAIQVDDDGSGPLPDPHAGSGKGIVGMRERAAALGGELQAGPRPGGGFRIRARLPLDGAS